MTRILENNEKGPYKLNKSDIKGDSIFLCRCGLSSTVFCNGSHVITKNEPENVLVEYERDENGKLEMFELEEIDDEDFDDDDENCEDCKD